MKRLLFFAVFCALFYSCSVNINKSGDIKIDYRSFSVKTFESSDSSLFKKSEILALDSRGSRDYMFADVDKILFRNGLYYILDTGRKKLVVFDSGGQPVFQLNKVGRGPEEYSHITDFAVGDDGNIWILDTRNKAVLNFDSSGRFLSKNRIRVTAEAIDCLEDGGFLFAVAPWDDSEYKNRLVVKCDSSFIVQESFIDRSEYEDTSFEFPCLGFLDNGKDRIFYLKPMDDHFYLFDRTGNLKSGYLFDFGSGRVPDACRNDIERNLSRINQCVFPVLGAYVSNNKVFTMLRDNGKYKEVVLDLKKRQVLDLSGLDIRLLAVNGSKAFFLITGGNLPVSLPAGTDVVNHQAILICELD
ncbi:MAG: 6-bladed beta-propeller [Bacteroidales bacterium]|jgi:hypothetical protein|nr:6-bladed beta-propeller [Bacteroidales bacterium]MCI1785519.1 6-bladed beta-propeller [Bacteroidales bacterium]